MTIEFSLCIDGKWICADARSSTPVINPSTEEVLGSAPIATSDDLERALAAADRSFASWGATDVASRAQLLRKVAKVITDRTEEIARVIALEQGKPLQQSRGEVGGGVPPPSERVARLVGCHFGARSAENPFYARRPS